MSRMIPSLAERFEAKVNRHAPGGCHAWISTAERKGYGVVWAWGKVQYAHRIAWLLAGRELKPGLVIDHVCRNTKCVNVDHLRLVPSRTNTLENNLSPIAANARREVCIKGHRFAPETTAIYTAKKKFTRHGNPMKPGPVRVCLICRPHYWRWAIIPRDPPPNARLRGTGRGAE